MNRWSGMPSTKKHNVTVRKMLMKITKVDPLRPDDRGLAYAFTARNSSYFIVLNRREGTISGKHHHMGKTQSKSPEILYMIKGKAKVVAEDLKSHAREEHEIEENDLIEIPSGIYHEVHALTDIIFLELNAEKSDFKHDTIWK